MRRRKDRLCLPANAVNIAQRIPGAEVVMVAGANHILMTDQPEQVSKTLLHWLDRNA